MKPDVLNFTGREALSEPFSWDIEFTTPQARITPEQILPGNTPPCACAAAKRVHGIITHLKWLSTTADQSHYQVVLSARLALLAAHPPVPRVPEPVGS